MRIAWVTDQPDEVVREKINFAHQRGFSIRLVNHWDDLLKKSNDQRVATVIYSMEDNLGSSFRALQRFIDHPESDGVRILISFKEKSDLFSAEALDSFWLKTIGLGVKDCLAEDLEPKLWLERLTFSALRRPHEVNRREMRLEFAQAAKLIIPARVSWISETKLGLEASVHVNPTSGPWLDLRIPSLFELIGDSLGPFKVKVLSTRSSQLDFHLSHHLQVDTTEAWTQATKQKIMDYASRNLSNDLKMRRKRVFAIVKDPQLRRLMQDTFTDHRFDLSFALTKNHASGHLKYGSPNFLLIEDAFFEDQDWVRDLNNLKLEKCPVFFLGQRQKFAVIKSKNLISDLHFLSTEKLNYLNAYQDEAQANEPGENRFYIPEDHPLSFADLRCDAVLRSLGPSTLSWTTPLQLSRFSIVALAVNDKNHLVKITEVSNTVQKGKDRLLGYEGYLSSQSLVSAQRWMSATAALFSGSATIDQAQKLVPKESMDKLTTTPHLAPMKPKNEATVLNLKKAPTVKKDQDFYYAIAFVALVVFALFAVFTVSFSLQPYLSKSGSIYTESLKKFAPKAFEKSQDSH